MLKIIIKGNILLMDYSIALNQDILSDLGKRLKQQRLNQNMSSADLARLSGVSVRTITGFERGQKNISLVNLMELLRALKLINHLGDTIPEIPIISPLDMVKFEKNTKKRVRK